MNNIEFLKEQIDISSYVDEIIESCQEEQLGLPYALNRILKKSLKKIDAIFGFIYTYDESMKKRFFYSGAKEFIDEFNLRKLQDSEESLLWDSKDFILVLQPLDIAGEKIGSVGFIFPKEDSDNYTEKNKIRVNLFCEEIDNYLYNINHSRIKQNLVKELNYALRNPILNDGIINAISILKDSVLFKDIFLIYRNDRKDSNWHYKYFIKDTLVYDSTIKEFKNEKLEEKIRNNDILSLSNKEVAKLLNLSEHVENLLITGATEDDELGKILISSTGKGFNTYAKDLIDLFSQTINYRLIDFNRERSRLRRFFSQDTTYRLLAEPNYKNHHLKPQVKDVAILFTDINSFTKISEQVFDNPQELGVFIDTWSSGAIDIVYKNGGVFDKMVGDCVIALFAPPFFDKKPIDCIASALKTAYEIQKFTIELGKKVKKILESPLLENGLGVATGINFAPLNVGFFGPYEDYTGFSSGMNNTARLQALASFRETFIMENLKDYLDKIKDEALLDIEFSLKENQKSKVKNVKDPLSYYPVDFNFQN